MIHRLRPFAKLVLGPQEVSEGAYQLELRERKQAVKGEAALLGALRLALENP